MLNFVLMLGMFIPHTEVKLYPKPDPGCLYNWISDFTKIENKCEVPLEIDTAYKNGLGSHFILNKGEVWSLKPVAVKVFMCQKGMGVASASEDRLVHPGFKTDNYVCLGQTMVMPDTPYFKFF